MGISVVTKAISGKYTDNSIKGVSGVLAGKNCTITNTTFDTDGNSVVTFTWTADDGTKRNTDLIVSKGVDAKQIKGIVIDKTDNHLKITLDDDTVIDAGEMPMEEIKLSSEEGNALIMKEDGLYVSASGVEISKEEDNAIESKADGLYVKKVDSVSISKEDGNIIKQKDDGLYAKADEINKSAKEKNILSVETDGLYVPETDLSDLVEKEDGKSLVSDTDIEQITTNKTAIELLNGDDTKVGSVDYKIALAIGDLTGFDYKIVTELPATGEKGIIYLVPVEDAEEPDLHDEYIWIETKFEKIGSTKVDMSDYEKAVQEVNKEDYDKLSADDKKDHAFILKDVDSANEEYISTLPSGVKGTFIRNGVVYSPSVNLTGYAKTADVVEQIGNLADLKTTEKKNIVGAINEVVDKNIIDDNSTSTDKTWSANKLKGLPTKDEVVLSDTKPINDCNNPTVMYCNWNADTLNTPYKQGLTGYTLGQVITNNLGGASYLTQIAITKGGGYIYTRYLGKAEEGWSEWIAVAKKGTSGKTDIANADNFTGSLGAYKNDLTVTISSWGKTVKELATANGYAAIGVLPAGYRPRIELIHYILFNNTYFGQLIIEASGSVKVGYTRAITNPSASANLPSGTNCYFATSFAV